MSDHWKSLADRLGAPGLDPLPEKKVEEKAADTLPQDEVTIEAAQEGTMENPESAEFDSDLTDEPAIEITNLEVVDEASEADVEEEKTLINEAEDEGNEDTEDVATEPDLGPDAELSFRRFRNQPQSEEVTSGADDSDAEIVQAVRPAPKRQSTASEAKSAKKPKRKSSWERLANMFSLGGGDSEEPETSGEELDEPESSEAKLDETIETQTEDAANDLLDSDDAREDESESPEVSLSIFGEDDEQPEANPALEAMFADAPRKDLDAKSSKRVVNDVDWEDEYDEPLGRKDESEEEQYQPDEEGDDEISLSFRKPAPAAEEEPEEGSARRGRRRRRGRGRSEGRAEKAPEPKDDWEDSAEEESTTKNYSDNEEFADDDSKEVERRSNRRRRRGRRPGNEEASQEEPRARRRQEEDEEDEPVQARRRSARDEEDDSSEERRPKRRRRRGQDERARSNSPREESVEPDEEDVAETKHRNIPTWADALDPLVEANTENHRRSENNRRGDGRGRGRSRGRRS
ncbi:MAG: hypothetical protein AAF483_02490 [Planctomycetota bacterium]